MRFYSLAVFLGAAVHVSARTTSTNTSGQSVGKTSSSSSSSTSAQSSSSSSNSATSSPSTSAQSSSASRNSSVSGSDRVDAAAISTPPVSGPIVSSYTATKESSTVLDGIVWSSTSLPGFQDAMQCWSQYVTWKSSSTSWYKESVQGKVFPVYQTNTVFTEPTSSSTTIYPSNPSTYKLCDHSPRVNVDPSTIRTTFNVTSTSPTTAIATPTFTPAPCTPDTRACRYWYQDSNMNDHASLALDAQCGYPAHYGSPCVIYGGPIQMLYWPVAEERGNLCANNASLHPTPSGKTTPAPPTVTTLGHTFTSGKVYLSFETLGAAYDGFGDPLGPTLTNTILTFNSEDISTQCGGSESAKGMGTAITWADLNWPVPASAYACQNRCSSLFVNQSAIANTAPQCSTIWSDINPNLAIPTAITNVVPEWKSCSFYDDFIPNFYFDPPIALQQVNAVATPSVPGGGDPTTTPASPSTTPGSPTAPNTSPPTSTTPPAKNTPTVPSQPDQSSSSSTASNPPAPAPQQSQPPSPAPAPPANNPSPNPSPFPAGSPAPNDPSVSNSAQSPTANPAPSPIAVGNPAPNPGAGQLANPPPSPQSQPPINSGLPAALTSLPAIVDPASTSPASVGPAIMSGLGGGASSSFSQIGAPGNTGSGSGAPGSGSGTSSVPSQGVTSGSGSLRSGLVLRVIRGLIALVR